MTIRSMSLACWALVAFLGASQSIAAQTTSPPQEKSHRVQDSEAVALNNLLAAGQAAMDANSFTTAAQNFRDYLAKKPDDALAHFQLGYACAALKQPAEAQSEFEKAVQLDPKMAQAHLNLGILLLDMDPPGAIAPLQKAAELRPNDPRPRMLLGWAFERAGNNAAAIDQYRAVEKLDEKNLRVHLALGRALLSTSHSSDAEAEFRAALAREPDSAEAHLGLAQALLSETKPEAAEAELAMYLQTHPNDSGTRVQLASVLANLGKNEEALTELDRVERTAPENLPALRLRAQIYMQTKRFDDATTVLEKAAKLAPQDADVQAQLGHAYLEKKEYPNAVRVLIVAWKMAPSDNDVLGDLIAAEYLSKNYSAVLRGLDVLSKRKTLPLGTLFVRATCYDKLGQAAQALQAYQQFLSVNKDENSDMYFQASARARFLARELKEKKR